MRLRRLLLTMLLGLLPAVVPASIPQAQPAEEATRATPQTAPISTPAVRANPTEQGFCREPALRSEALDWIRPQHRYNPELVSRWFILERAC